MIKKNMVLVHRAENDEVSYYMMGDVFSFCIDKDDLDIILVFQWKDEERINRLSQIIDVDLNEEERAFLTEFPRYVGHDTISQCTGLIREKFRECFQSSTYLLDLSKLMEELSTLATSVTKWVIKDKIYEKGWSPKKTPSLKDYEGPFL